MALLGLFWLDAPLSSGGVGASLISGGFASGLGYALWYRVLPRLDAWQAGVLQLLTPPLAAFGAILFLGESLTPNLIGASLLCLGGLLLILRRHRNPNHAR